MPDDAIKQTPGTLFSHKLRYIISFGLVEMAISTNPKHMIYRNFYENTDPGDNGGPHETRIL